jgi:hypothetical protein
MTGGSRNIKITTDYSVYFNTKDCGQYFEARDMHQKTNGEDYNKESFSTIPLISYC